MVVVCLSHQNNNQAFHNYNLYEKVPECRCGAHPSKNIRKACSIVARRQSMYLCTDGSMN